MGAGGACERAAVGVAAAGPRERGPVRIRRVRGSQEVDRRAFAGDRRGVPRSAEPVDRSGERELRRAEALDEVATPDATGLLERPEDRIDGRERELVVTKVDGLPVADSPVREILLAAGFAPGYRGLVLRAR